MGHRSCYSRLFQKLSNNVILTSGESPLMPFPGHLITFTARRVLLQSHQSPMALQQAEKDQFGIEIAQELSQTRYTCSELTLLGGGTANFLFRGILAQPLQDGTKTVVIKHSKEYVAVNRHFEMNVSRCVSFFLCIVLQFLFCGYKYADFNDIYLSAL